MNKCEWSLEALIGFIKLYKEKKCLWQMKSIAYTRKDLKVRAWEDLINYTRRYFPKADKQFVRSKIQKLRTAFSREYKRVEASKRDGRSPSEVHKPCLWYYDLLSFVKDGEQMTDWHGVRCNNSSLELSHLNDKEFFEEEENYKSEAEMDLEENNNLLSERAKMNELFNVRWNNYTAVLHSVFQRMLASQKFVDVSLACEGKSIKCHRFILSACSPYFETLFSENEAPNLVVYMKDMKYKELEALVYFMYNGEVSVTQEDLKNLVKAAEALKIKGLANGSQTEDSQGNVGSDYRSEGLMEKDFGKKKKASNLAEKRKAVQNDGEGKRKLSGTESASSNKTAKLPKLVPNGKAEETSNQESIKCSPSQETEAPEIKMEEAEDVDPSGRQDDFEYVELDHGEVNEHSGDSDVDIQQGGLGSNRRYHPAIKQSALTAIKSGVSIRQCSSSFGIPRKTLSKWKAAAGMKPSSPKANSSAGLEESDLDAEDNLEQEIVGISLSPPPRIFGSIDPQERAQLLRKAMELAMTGVTVRQAAAHFGIPRTTLVAYMKKRGLRAPTARLPPKQTEEQNNSFGLMGISHFMDELSSTDAS